ncbi:MAG: HAD family hydrolase [Nitrospinota bacterium]
MVKAILFDFGGTLDSDGVHWVDQLRAAYEAAGLSPDPATFNPAFFESDRRILAERDMRGKTLLDLVAIQVDLIHGMLGLGSDAGKAGVVRAFEAEAGRVLRRNREILARLARRFRLGVVSNFCGNLDVICRDYGLAECLAVVVDSFVVGVEKPDPAIFRLALEGIGAEAEEALFVGDNPDRDIRPAKALGMGTVWLRGTGGPGGPGDPSPPEADRTVRSLTELEDAL